MNSAAIIEDEAETTLRDLEVTAISGESCPACFRAAQSGHAVPSVHAILRTSQYKMTLLDKFVS